MINLHWLLYLLALIFFVIAALPHKINLRFEWLAFAMVVLTKMV